MTARLCYEAILIELNKENAPNILLEDFNYLFNKAINQYINKRYNIYDINQQTTDDLRVLKATSILPVHKALMYDNDVLGKMMGATYEVNLPSDYLHLLNCICIYKVNKTFKCYNKGDIWRRPATRLTSDIYSQVLDNFWMRPTYRKPYYYIHNVNYTGGYGDNPSADEFNPETITRNDEITNSSFENGDWTTEVTTNPYNESRRSGTDINIETLEVENVPNVVDKSRGIDAHGTQILNGDDTPLFHTVNIDGVLSSNVERAAKVRYGNTSKVRLELRYGTDDTLFKLTHVYIDYIKAPLNIRLTLEQLDYTEDTSQMLEFPDYVCQEIINELVNIIMENISDLRLQTHPIVSLSIANPAQQLAAALPAQ